MNYALGAKLGRMTGVSLATLAFATSVMAQEDADRTLDPVLVTTQKTAESIQDVPIAVSAFDEDSLEKLQLAGGPDLVKAIPNVAFSRTNFGGFNFKIRGIGADVISQSGDPGVGIHQNDIPLSNSRFFEAEFFDVERVEVLRGPQGTLYGRNATGGVTNIITAKPVFEEYQANAQITLGNYDTVKFKGMLNAPLGDRAALRVAGSILERDGFATNEATGSTVDDRDLFSVRATLAFEPTDRLSGWISVDHFEEDDTRLRNGRQVCDKDPTKTSFGMIPISEADQVVTSQGCLGGEPILAGLGQATNSTTTLTGGLGAALGLLDGDVFTDPLSTDLRTGSVIFDPVFEAEQTMYSWNLAYDLTDALELTYLGSHFESSTFSSNAFGSGPAAVPYNATTLFPGGFVPDAQFGTLNTFTSSGSTGSSAENTSHELRLQSDFDGRFNFNFGAIKFDAEAADPSNPREGTYVFSNSLTAVAITNNAVYQGTLAGALMGGATQEQAEAAASNAAILGGLVDIDNSGNGEPPLFSNVSGTGANYFRTISPFELESFALFGEGYFDVTDDLQLTVGLRYTDDKKEQVRIPTFALSPTSNLCPEQNGNPLNPAFLRLEDGDGDACTGELAPADEGGDGTQNASFQETTGRIGLDWSPDLGFSEDTLIYAFYSRGYKGGGINPPQPATNAGVVGSTFDPEFVNAYEIGTKNTLAGGALQLNATGFYYDYEGYQISQIVNRTASNLNIDAEISGFELETVWRPTSSLTLNANLGLLDTEIQDAWAINLRDRTNGRSDLVVLSTPLTGANCVVSAVGYQTVLGAIFGGGLPEGSTADLCAGSSALAEGIITQQNGGMDPTPGVQGTGNAAQDIATVEAVLGLTGQSVDYVNTQGEVATASALTPFEGEAADLSGNSLQNSPDTTLNFGAEYTWGGIADGAWDVSARADYYYQSESFARAFNTVTDELDSWDNLNLSVRFTNPEQGFWIEIFGKNVTDEEVITGHSLGDEAAGLATNIFLTEPQTYGITFAKSW